MASSQVAFIFKDSVLEAMATGMVMDMDTGMVMEENMAAGIIWKRRRGFWRG
jgi:hypothetical protein